MNCLCRRFVHRATVGAIMRKGDYKDQEEVGSSDTWPNSRHSAMWIGIAGLCELLLVLCAAVKNSEICDMLFLC